MSEKQKLSNMSLGLIVLIIAIIGYGVFQYAQPSKAQITDDAFGERVRAYLMSNPTVLRDVIGELGKQEQANAEMDKKALIASLATDLKQDSMSFVAGNPDGDVTIVEFFDYRCGYCKRSFPDLMKAVEEDGNIRLVLKEFPILGEDSVQASRAAIASMAQGKYMEFHTALMASRGALTKERILNIATDVGLDAVKLEADMDTAAIKEVISKNHAIAQQLGINGTPAFVIEDQFAPGALSADQLQNLVTAARESISKTATN
ncbi:MAG: hypothetical protein COB93_09050 [Sneathiella sp.]|nr:MAG: hypothetical protein COB93_09050 [Sneathiella sp.]